MHGIGNKHGLGVILITQMVEHATKYPAVLGTGREFFSY